MLSFEQKLAVLDCFTELQRKNVSLGRVNYHYEQSVHEKKTVAYHLHPNGNGFVYGALLKGYPTDDKGMVNIRDFTADELRTIVSQSIQSLSTHSREAAAAKAGKPPKRQNWIGPGSHSLTVVFEEDVWYVYSGPNLDVAFETYEEVEQYMREEGYTRR
ncbi:MAG: hypothetical protein K0Q59_5297 [Paenibacillus sp.]|jgi:hypothetical protein|nr:hypothetical protein [Paenibacillus sp.]